jgi:nitroreductase
MKKTDIYKTIFKRKSIRNYDLTPLDENMLSEILEYMKTLKPMYKNIKIEMHIISQKDVKRRLMKKAPHYIVVFSENKEGYLTNVGFMLQQMDLYLSAKGIGSCWQGIPKPTQEILKGSKLEFIILIAFGKAKEPLNRKSISEFKRKPLEQITNIFGADELLEPARLAPSAANGQPWFFIGDKGTIHAYSDKPNFLKALLLKKYNEIDMGIAICHLWIAAEHFNMNNEIICDKVAKNNPPDGYYYIATMKIKSKS